MTFILYVRGPATNNKLPSISEFLFNLDQKYNYGVYSKFEKVFHNEKITVNTIKDLSNEEMQALKLGGRKISGKLHKDIDGVYIQIYNYRYNKILLLSNILFFFLLYYYLFYE